MGFVKSKGEVHELLRRETSEDCEAAWFHDPVFDEVAISGSRGKSDEGLSEGVSVWRVLHTNNALSISRAQERMHSPTLTLSYEKRT